MAKWPSWSIGLIWMLIVVCVGTTWFMWFFTVLLLMIGGASGPALLWGPPIAIM